MAVPSYEYVPLDAAPLSQTHRTAPHLSPPVVLCCLALYAPRLLAVTAAVSPLTLLLPSLTHPRRATGPAHSRPAASPPSLVPGLLRMAGVLPMRRGHCSERTASTLPA
ncbi:hypothetical protein BU16DRAFT_138309 [Lophium mytilinum]|uniref:Uncharacterized protein n=1 Tax=Lophium mytilinum TaxID=390894 RepID=A0A6A6QFH0_9PEZI|nr:hypothetical protein BU16DRAFT_138309 [Lophium mytilinum]